MSTAYSSDAKELLRALYKSFHISPPSTLHEPVHSHSTPHKHTEPEVLPKGDNFVYVASFNAKTRQTTKKRTVH